MNHLARAVLVSTREARSYLWLSYLEGLLDTEPGGHALAKRARVFKGLARPLGKVLVHRMSRIA